MHLTGLCSKYLIVKDNSRGGDLPMGASISGLANLNHVDLNQLISFIKICDLNQCFVLFLLLFLEL